MMQIGRLYGPWLFRTNLRMYAGTLQGSRIVTVSPEDIVVVDTRRKFVRGGSIYSVNTGRGVVLLEGEAANEWTSLNGNVGSVRTEGEVVAFVRVTGSSLSRGAEVRFPGGRLFRLSECLDSADAYGAVLKQFYEALRRFVSESGSSAV